MPGMPTQIEDVETIKRLIRQGDKPKKIAEKVGVSVNIVYRIVQQVKKEANIVGENAVDPFLPTIDMVHDKHFGSTLKAPKKEFPKVVDKETGKVYYDVTECWQ